jgi:ubiquinone/menaquinone biosynthesis C-methylase UbiE
MIGPVPPDSLIALATAVLEVPDSPERILVVGCGEGESAFFLAREYPAARVRGVDGSESAIRAATGRVGLDPEGRIAFKLGRPRSLPYPDGLFDLVVQAHGVLRLGEVVRVLRAGGQLIYLERPRPRKLLRPRPRRLRRGLERAGFETLQSSEVAGETYYVGRLRDADDAGHRPE